jgi:hypothetical protein
VVGGGAVWPPLLGRDIALRCPRIRQLPDAIPTKHYANKS